MPRKKRKIPEAEQMIARMQQAGISTETAQVPAMTLATADEILAYLKQIQLKKTNEMICFIMYDIEDNKIRREVSKYLLKKGCQRVQKSVFLAKLDYKLFREIHHTLQALQEVYENDDTILLVPISENELQKMKMIGRNMNFELTLGKRNMLFF